MCGPARCEPMHPGCTWSPEHRKACWDRHIEADRLCAVADSDYGEGVRQLKAYEAANGAEAGRLLRAEIKRLRGRQ